MRAEARIGRYIRVHGSESTYAHHAASTGPAV
jgi:hypothetical protein